MFYRKKVRPTQYGKHKLTYKKKGFVLVPVVLATFIVGMLGIGLSSMYSGTFSVMNSGKAASQAKQFATVEGDILKVAGYDGSSDITHDWQSLQSVVGADGANWESKVEDTGRTETSPSGDQVKVMKVSVRKNNELVSRYSEEVPLVNGADTMSRAEIQALVNALQGQIDNLTSQLTALNGRVDYVQSEVDSINNQIQVINTTINALQNRVENYRNELLKSIATEKAARESADAAEANARKAAINQEVTDRNNAINNAITGEANARNAAIKASSDSLNKRMDGLLSQIEQLRKDVNGNTDKILKNTRDIQANTTAINAINRDMTALKTTVEGHSKSIDAIKNRLDSNEFIKNNTTGNNIKIGWDGKALYGMVDGNKVPLSTQDDDIKHTILDYSKREDWFFELAWPTSGITRTASSDGVVFVNYSSTANRLPEITIDGESCIPPLPPKFDSMLTTIYGNITFEKCNGSVNFQFPIGKGQKFYINFHMQNCASYNIASTIFFIPYKA